MARPSEEAMSDRPIQKGDLVMVVKLPRCGCLTTLGMIFTVASRSDADSTTCRECGDHIDGPIPYAWMPIGSKFTGSTLNRLKRIPPLSESEGIETKEELTA